MPAATVADPNKTERCTIGPTLRSTGPAAAGGMANLFTIMLAAMGNKSAQQEVKTYPAGVRMAGAYTNAGGLKISFALEGTVLDCGEAHAGRQYIVENDGSSIRAVIVDGRLVTGMAGAEVTFRPVRTSCPD